jgi:crotonobetainyl-CoA:carnitine CoA-transferase CaiB-like acyl-CoA transferase
VSQRSALDGIRVLEVGNYIAGPYCATILADLGADVLKVEEPGVGDVVRSYGAMFPEVEDSATFLTLNRNKRSIGLNLKDPAGKEIFRRMTSQADVVVENLRPGAMRRLGLDYEALSAANPGLIYVAASGWGQDGPLSADAGLDIMAQARSGIMSVTGDPGGGPAKAGLPVCDIGCAMYGAIGVLAALHHRNATGEGQHIDVSLHETGVSYALWEWAKVSATGAIPTRLGAVHPTAAPYQALRARDGWFTVGAGTPRTWQSFCGAMSLEWMTTDTRFETNADRVDNRAELIAEIELLTLQEPVDHWLATLRKGGVPCAPIQDYARVFEDEVLTDRNWFWESTAANGTSVRQMGSPVRMSKSAPVRRNAGPQLGDSTLTVLADLGVRRDDIDGLLQRGVIAVGAEDEAK